MATVKKTNASDKRIRGDKPESGSHFQMHEEHRQWLSDINSWRDDLTEWQAEIRKLLVELKGLQSVVETQDRALVAHSEAIFTHRQSLTSHEHLLAQFEQGGTSDELIRCSLAHEEESEKHARQKSCHETMKQQQRTLVSQWEHLHKAIAGLPKT